MEKISHDLTVGDTLKMIWCGNKRIMDFAPYIGTFDFVERIAIFTDGTRMSITKGYYYEVI